MDDIILGTSVACFAAFILSHLIFLRFLKPAVLLKITLILYLSLLCIDIWFCRFYGIAGIFLSIFMLSLFICVYLLRVIGIFETSVRFKLVGLLGTKKGITLEEISEKLSSKSILDSRLKRFVEFKNITYDGQYYSLNKKNIMYTFFNFIDQGLKKIITPPKK